jgi:hypothetical protein
MKVTRNVILDLLPLYLAGEASEDTRRLVEHYLETDPRLTQMAQQAQETKLPDDIPIPLTEDDEVKAFNKTKRLMWQHTLFLLLAVFFTIAFAWAMATPSRPLGHLELLVVAGLSWFLFYRVNKRLGE